jgi:DNA-directed RNA polymerase specialized sigma24 family protein
MRRRGDHTSGNMRPVLPELVQQKNATALQRLLDDNAEELIWIAEVITGNRQAGEQRLDEAMKLAQGAHGVDQEWLFSWVKRLLVRVALEQIRREIRELLPPVAPQIAVTLARVAVSSPYRHQLRSMSSQEIIASFDVLERACLILYAYLQYPMLDCALLLGCPRSWIEPICERVLTKITEIGEMRQMASVLLMRCDSGSTTDEGRQEA